MGPDITKILVPVDFSDCSSSALRSGVELAQHFEASVIAVHVWERPNLVAPDVMLYTPGFEGVSLVEYARSEAETHMASMIEEINSDAVEVSYRFVTGRPFKKIVEVAEHDRVDLIVMGSHGRTGLAHLFLGSVAEKVLRRAPCPVLVVRAQ